MRKGIAIRLFLLPLLAAAGCESAAPPPADPPGWTRWVASAGHGGVPGYSIAVPPEVRQVPVQGIDSEVAEFRGDGLRISLDYGWYGGFRSCTGLADCVEEESSIDGYPARIARGEAREAEVSRFVSAKIEGMSPRRAPMETSLVFHAACSDAATCRTAEQILRSVDFDAVPQGVPIERPGP